MRRGLAIVILGIIAAVVVARPVFAADTTTKLFFAPEVAIPGFSAQIIDGTTVAKYISAVFYVVVSGVCVIGVTMLVYGGVRWVVANGNPGQITEAKGVIENAIIGIIIALGSFVFFNLISPDLVALKTLDLPSVIGQDFTQMVPALLSSSKDITFSCSSLYSTLNGLPDTAQPYRSIQISSDSQGKLNSWISSAAGNAVDPVLVKAIMLTESKAKSQPTNGGDGTGTKVAAGTGCGKDGTVRCGSAYGLGQFVSATLAVVLKQQYGTYPAACPYDASHKWIARQANGSLVESCQKFLDRPPKSPDYASYPQNGLQDQVKMMTTFVSALTQQFSQYGSDAKKLAVMAYNIGPNLLGKYESDGQVTSVDRQQDINSGLAYAAAVKAHYDQICAASIRTPSGGRER